MCNGTFKDKDLDEAMKYLDLLAENAQNWDIADINEAPGKTQPHTSSGGMYNLRENHDLQAKFASLARKVEALELKRIGQLKFVQELCVKSVKLVTTQQMIVQPCLLLGNVSMNKSTL
jgi:hypothetical protein